MRSFPLYLRTFCPRKSKPSSTWVMRGFSGESSNPRSFMNCSTRGFTVCSRTSFDLPVIMKSSAKRTKFTFSLLLPRWALGTCSRNFLSRPSKAILAITGEHIPPCGVPSSVACSTCLSMNPAFSHFLTRRNWSPQAFPQWGPTPEDTAPAWPCTTWRASSQHTTSFDKPSVEWVTVTHPHHPLHGQRVQLIRVRRGPDPDLIIRMPDGYHGAITASLTDYAGPPETDHSPTAPPLLSPERFSPIAQC